MNWNYEGLSVTGTYLNEFTVTGIVQLSRVKYGGGVQHTILLDKPVEIYNQIRDRLLLDHRDIISVKSNV
jgi:hypothetical protein